MLPLKWLPSALDDLDTIVAFIAENNVSAAYRTHEGVQTSAEFLSQQPYIGKPGRIDGTREWVISASYLLVYRVTADTVEIASVVHTRQEYPR